MLGLPIRAHLGYRTQKFPLEDPEMLHVEPSAVWTSTCWLLLYAFSIFNRRVFSLVSLIISFHIMNLQQPPLVHPDMQKKLTSSDNGTTDKNMAPKFIFDSGNIMEGNISKPSSPEELLEV
jgi:hypothetical protein